MSLELPYGYKNLDPEGSSNVDEAYGYYDSLGDAYVAVPLAMRKGGRTVGIKQGDGSIVEYWWENDNDLTNGGLVVKTAGGGTFDPNDYDLADFPNEGSDPYIRNSELGDAAKSNDYNDLDNLPDLSVFD